MVFYQSLLHMLHQKFRILELGEMAEWTKASDC